MVKPLIKPGSCDQPVTLQVLSAIPTDYYTLGYQKFLPGLGVQEVTS